MACLFLHFARPMRPTFSIVVPVYNEAVFLPRALPEMVRQLDSLGDPYELLIVENGSSDGTAEIARRAGQGHPVRVISREEPDYGAAMRHGFLEAHCGTAGPEAVDRRAELPGGAHPPRSRRYPVGRCHGVV